MILQYGVCVSDLAYFWEHILYPPVVFPLTMLLQNWPGLAWLYKQHNVYIITQLDLFSQLHSNLLPQLLHILFGEIMVNKSHLN